MSKLLEVFYSTMAEVYEQAIKKDHDVSHLILSVNNEGWHEMRCNLPFMDLHTPNNGGGQNRRFMGEEFIIDVEQKEKFLLKWESGPCSIFDGHYSVNKVLELNSQWVHFQKELTVEW